MATFTFTITDIVKSTLSITADTLAIALQRAEQVKSGTTGVTGAGVITPVSTSSTISNI